LKGAERAVFVAAVADLAEDLQTWEQEHTTGVGKFDRFSFGQRAALLEDVTAALVDPAVPVPTHTAANEAAIYAIFARMKEMVEVELDTEGQPEFRDLLSSAARECEIERVPAPADHNEEEWDYCVDALSDRSSGITTFSDEDLFVDAGLEGGADEGAIPYFASITRDPRDSEIPVCFERIARLTITPPSE